MAEPLTNRDRVLALRRRYPYMRAADMARILGDLTAERVRQILSEAGQPTKPILPPSSAAFDA